LEVAVVIEILEEILIVFDFAYPEVLQDVAQLQEVLSDHRQSHEEVTLELTLLEAEGVVAVEVHQVPEQLEFSVLLTQHEVQEFEQVDGLPLPNDLYQHFAELQSSSNSQNLLEFGQKGIHSHVVVCIAMGLKRVANLDLVWRVDNLLHGVQLTCEFLGQAASRTDVVEVHSSHTETIGRT